MLKPLNRVQTQINNIYNKNVLDKNKLLQLMRKYGVDINKSLFDLIVIKDKNTVPNYTLASLCKKLRKSVNDKDNCVAILFAVQGTTIYSANIDIYKKQIIDRTNFYYKKEITGILKDVYQYYMSSFENIHILICSEKRENKETNYSRKTPSTSLDNFMKSTESRVKLPSGTSRNLTYYNGFVVDYRETFIIDNIKLKSAYTTSIRINTDKIPSYFNPDEVVDKSGYSRIAYINRLNKKLQQKKKEQLARLFETEELRNQWLKELIDKCNKIAIETLSHANNDNISKVGDAVIPTINRLYANLRSIRYLIGSDFTNNDFTQERVMTYFNKIKRDLLQLENCEL